MKRLMTTLFIVLLLATLVVPASALAEDFPGDNWATYFTYTINGPMTVDLIAGQYMDVGSVEISNDGTYLYVEYDVDAADLYLLEVHVAVADTFDGIPQTKTGNPKIGHFPYKAEFDLEDEVTNPDPFEIPLDGLDANEDGVLYIATHAALSNGETGWSGDEDEPEASIDIEKYVSVDGKDTWHDADAAPGPTANVASTVYFLYEVTNPGDLPLSNVEVWDDNGTPLDTSDDFQPTYVSGDDGDAILQKSEIWIYESSATAIEGLYTNIGDVTGYWEGTPYTDDDPANYNGETPGVVNWYIGYEDWPNGDFDYNDFGMYFSATEYYDENDCLTRVMMTFSAEIYDAGANHLIHIKRTIAGGSSYTVTRSEALFGGETPAGTYTGSGDVDVVLYDTTKYTWPQKQMGEVVIVDIVVDDPSLNPMNKVAPRWDLDSFMGDYDPWLETLGGVLPAGYEWNLIDMQTPTSLNNGSGDDGLLDPALVGLTLPYILVVPVDSWIPPYEESSISGYNLVNDDRGPYAYFYDYYSTTGASHQYWYTEITDPEVRPGGLSW